MAKQLDPELLLRKALGERSDAVCERAVKARAAVLKAAKGCSEMLYQSYAVSNVFTFTGKLGQAFIHIATYANHVNLGFNQGASLDDEHGILAGTGKAIRHIRLDDDRTISDSQVKALIKQAVKQGRSMADAQGGIQPVVFVDKTS